MPQRFNIYWYQDVQAVRDAALCNLRDRDLLAGGNIRRGDIIAGQCGFAVAEQGVSGFKGSVRAYRPNRCIEWQGYFLTCMALDGLPTGSQLRGTGSALRHKHYVVAEFTSADIVAKAKKLGLPVIQCADGRALANLEVFSVPGRTPECRRAKLL